MLTECPECNHRISDKARACPQCGHPIVGSGDPVKDAVYRMLGRERIFLAFTAAGSALWWIISLVAPHSRHRSTETAFWVMVLSIVGLAIISLKLAARQQK